jgi:glycosyltransferase involved in cell wall biosynthesis
MSETSDIATHAPAVSLVVAVKNEAENVAPLTGEIAAAMNGRWSFELVFVNDGSTDDTGVILRRLMAERPWVRQINHAATCGKAAAVRTGVAAARAPLIVTLDGDCQNDPSFIPAMVRALESGGARVGLVAGQRVAATLDSNGCSRASPTPCAARSCATEPATRAAASRRSGARPSWRSPISTACIVFCRRSSGAMAMKSLTSR